jgi:hypothetical protein
MVKVGVAQKTQRKENWLLIIFGIINDILKWLLSHYSITIKYEIILLIFKISFLLLYIHTDMHD